MARLTAEVTVRVLADRVADGQTMMVMDTEEDLNLAALAVPEAEGAQEAPEAEGALAALEEEEIPRMEVMTADEGVDAFTRTSRRSWVGSGLFMSNRPGEATALSGTRSVSATGAKLNRSRSRLLSRRTSSGSC